MSTKKTIQINPELFKVSGQKTRKNREKKELQINPIISPNNLKNKLLKRIKEHKTKEIQQNMTKPSNNILSNASTTNIAEYSDEFYGAINYLSELTKKQKQQQILHNKTVKTPSIVPTMTQSMISLELPPELAEPIMKPRTSDVFTVNYKPDQDVPYGCLKNGKKKTYREWKELTNPSLNVELPDLVRPPTPPKRNSVSNVTSNTNTSTNTNTNVFLTGATAIFSEANNIGIKKPEGLSREQRLEQIKNKLKKMQDEETQRKMKISEDFDKDMKKFDKEVSSDAIVDDLPDLQDNMSGSGSGAGSGLGTSISDLIKTRDDKIEKAIPKQFVKKTIKKKFTLGKSDKLRKVAVLIKNRQTRKNVINTQKELKKMSITDVRKYLRQHGIIKVGSTCPPDILRKTFESALLAGEITNINKDMLLHNFLNEEINE